VHPRLVTLSAIVLLSAAVCQQKQKLAKPEPAAAPAVQRNRANHTVDMTGADLLWLPATARLRPPIPIGPVATKNGRNVYIDDTADVYFEIDIDRDALASQVTSHFAVLGWQQRSDQMVNPGLATSFAGGWQPRHRLFLWHGEWDNAHHDLLTYDFMADGPHVHGGAYYQPVAVVEEVLQKAHRLRCEPAQMEDSRRHASLRFGSSRMCRASQTCNSSRRSPARPTSSSLARSGFLAS
jgi:hypothetical protein